MTDFTKVNLGDIEDVAPAHGLSEVMQARFANEPLGLEQTGISHQRVTAGTRLPFGHTHSRQEEIYVVISGSGEFRVGDELVALDGPLDTLRVAPGVWRGVQAGPDGLEFIAFGAPTGGERDAEMSRDWWPED